MQLRPLTDRITLADQLTESDLVEIVTGWLVGISTAYGTAFFDSGIWANCIFSKTY